MQLRSQGQVWLLQSLPAFRQGTATHALLCGQPLAARVRCIATLVSLKRFGRGLCFCPRCSTCLRRYNATAFCHTPHHTHPFPHQAHHMQPRSLSWGPTTTQAPLILARHPSSISHSQQWPAQRRCTLRVVARANGDGRPGSGSSSGGGWQQDPRRKPDRKAKKPGLFEVQVVTPPPRSLGVYALPPLTHNGEEIEIDGHGYVVTSLVLRYKLYKGKYVRDHSRLEVQPTGRYFLNMMLDNLIHAKYIGPTGEQD